MLEYLSPGVYVEAFENGIKEIKGVGTSTAGFIGMAEKGRTQGIPVLITSVGDFQTNFGGQLSVAEYNKNRYLSYAVESFFANGGSKCYVMRISPDDAEAATGVIELNAGDESHGEITFTAASEGKWGNGIGISLEESFSAKTGIEKQDGPKLTVKNHSDYLVGDLLKLTVIEEEGAAPECNYLLIKEINGNILTVADEISDNVVSITDNQYPQSFLQICTVHIRVTCGSTIEVFENVSLNLLSPVFLTKILAKSSLLKVSADLTLKSQALGQQLGVEKGKAKLLDLSNGENGAVLTPLSADMLKSQNDIAGARTGLDAFKELNDVSIMAIPGCHDAEVQKALIAHCEAMGNRFAILDTDVADKEISQLTAYKDKFDSTYAAIYHPWLQTYSGVEKGSTLIPPSGAMAGIYARTDNTRGIWKAPANEIIRGATGLSANYSDAVQSELSPKGINLIRALPGQGIRVGGARTLSANRNWKYINTRRLFIYIEESIKAATSWVVFEPNNELLWTYMKGMIETFLTEMWRSGALVGSCVGEAFFVNIGKGSTMTEDDILNGRLIYSIGIATVRPAEYGIFKIIQKMQVFD